MTGMKILIVSDSHGRWQTLQRLVERERPDRVFHLGDLLSDAGKLSFACPDTPVEGVLGNCDGWSARGDTALTLSYEGVRFFLTHGHAYRVKSGLELLVDAARARNADVVLFGHTHRALCQCGPGGLWVVNPGTAGGVGAPATYALAQVERGCATVQLKQVEEQTGR